MESMNEEFLNKILGFSETIEGINLTFKEESLERKYIESCKNNFLTKSKLFSIVMLISQAANLTINIITNKTVNRNASIYIATFVIEFIFMIIIYNNNFEVKVLRIFIYIRFFLFYFSIYFTFMFLIYSWDYVTVIRMDYGFFIFMNTIYLYILDFNILVSFILPILNISFLFAQKSLGFLGSYQIYPDCIVILIYYFSTYLLKKEEYLNRKLIFLESLKNQTYVEYTKNLIDDINNMIISIKNDQVVFYNNYTDNFLKKNKFIRSDEESIIKDNFDISISSKSNFELNDSINFFFKSLVISSPQNNEHHSDVTFSDKIKNIFLDKTTESRNFTRLGIFNIKNQQHFDVYTRKLMFKDEIVEVLIYDITEIKLAEKINIESLYKQKILAKIAHEFKTPLITAISFINKILENQEGIDPVNQKRLNQIGNLSNYVMILISDIIQYVSNSTNLRIVPSEFKLNDTLDFCFNVLKTLIECNENKNSKIKTILNIDEKVKNITISLDEHRLKQILLNFISNAVKFTTSGFIKLSARYKKDFDKIYICVKDTGFGIREEDKNLIFKENIQLNIEHDYNSRGSGLGLSIASSLANLLKLNIGFKSVHAKGSKFYVDIPFLNDDRNDKISKCELSHVHGSHKDD
jgi:signal transduction histidine kinase